MVDWSSLDESFRFFIKRVLSRPEPSEIGSACTGGVCAPLVPTGPELEPGRDDIIVVARVDI